MKCCCFGDVCNDPMKNVSVPVKWHCKKLGLDVSVSLKVLCKDGIVSLKPLYKDGWICDCLSKIAGNDFFHSVFAWKNYCNFCGQNIEFNIG
jgi:hypothetical protein